MKNQITCRVVVVGAGHAGGALAKELRALGHTGPITVIGAEPHPPYERPSLSKQFLSGELAEPVFVAPAAEWSALEVRLMRGTRVEVIRRPDRLVQLVNGEAVRYDKLVLATGGVARTLSFEGDETPVLRTIEDARALSDNARNANAALIIGAGVVGLEAAATLRGLGLSVTVIGREQTVMTRNVPADMAARMAEFHVQAGVDLKLGRRIAAIERAGHRKRVTLDNGETMLVDLTLAGIGITAATSLAQAAGLACRNGIVVDATYATDDADIFAIGDVAEPPCGRIESWAHAQSSARAAARAILELDLETPPTPWFWTHQYDHMLQIAGEPMAGKLIARDCLSLYFLENRLAGIAVLDSPRMFAKMRRLIGNTFDLAKAADMSADLR